MDLTHSRMECARFRVQTMIASFMSKDYKGKTEQGRAPHGNRSSKSGFGELCRLTAARLPRTVAENVNIAIRLAGVGACGKHLPITLCFQSSPGQSGMSEGDENTPVTISLKSQKRSKSVLSCASVIGSTTSKTSLSRAIHWSPRLEDCIPRARSFGSCRPSTRQDAEARLGASHHRRLHSDPGTPEAY